MSDFDFELENINAFSDLISFLPVPDFFTTDQRTRVQWNIGDSFDPHALDYIGLYNTEWETVDDYLAYKWAPSLPRHPYSIRRRCVQFTDSDLDHVRIPGIDFVFMYVSKGDNVVGISNKFQFRGSIGYEDDLCLGTLERMNLPKNENRKRLPSNLLQEIHSICSPSKKRTTKEKVTYIFRDPDTLASDFRIPPAWMRQLDIVQPVVKEYDDQQASSAAVVPYVPVIPNRDSCYCCAQVAVEQKEESTTKSRKKGKAKAKHVNKKDPVSTEPSTLSLQRLDYPIRLSLLPGPRGLVEQITAGAAKCSFCSLGRIVISEMLQREEKSSSSIKELQAKNERSLKQIREQANQIQNLKEKLADKTAVKMEEVVVKKKVKRASNTKPFSGSKEEFFLKKKIGELLKKNQGLLKQARYWKNQCTGARNELKNMQLPMVQNLSESNSKEEKETQHCGQQTSETKETTDSGCNTSSDTSSYDDDNKNEWKIQKGKRIARFQRFLSKQSQTIQAIRKTASFQREVISKQSKEVARLTKELGEQKKKAENTEDKLSEMTDRVKAILRGRSKKKTSEWRQIARKLNDESSDEVKLTPAGAASEPRVTCRTPDVVVKQPANMLGAIAGSLSAVLCGRQQHNLQVKAERVCPTCFMVFAPHVDPHVIEEHIVFHQIYTKKAHSD